MSWVCPLCSTSNADGERQCIVCDSERPGSELSFDLEQQIRSLSLNL